MPSSSVWMFDLSNTILLWILSSFFALDMGGTDLSFPDLTSMAAVSNPSSTTKSSSTLSGHLLSR